MAVSGADKQTQDIITTIKFLKSKVQNSVYKTHFLLKNLCHVQMKMGAT